MIDGIIEIWYIKNLAPPWRNIRSTHRVGIEIILYINLFGCFI